MQGSNSFKTLNEKTVNIVVYRQYSVTIVFSEKYKIRAIMYGRKESKEFIRMFV